MFIKILKIFFVAALLQIPYRAFAQGGFDKYLAMDSTYIYSSSVRSMDLLLQSDKDISIKDTGFYNTYGRAEVITLEQLLYFTINNNPELKQYQSSIESYIASSNEKSALPDPMLELETDDVASNFKKVGMINIYASQTFPFPGKLELERKSALQNKSILEYKRVDASVSKMNMVKQNYYNLYLNTKKFEINKDSQQLIKTFITAAESRYSVGKGMQQEVFKSQIELQRLINEEFILHQQRNNIYAAIAGVTKVIIDDNTQIYFQDIDEDYLLDAKNFDFSESDVNKLVDYALEHRADIKTIQSEMQLNRDEIEKANLSSMPDFNIKIGYKILPFEDHNAFDFMVGINIPFAPWSSGKYKYAVQRNELNLKTTVSMYDTRKAEIRTEILTAVNNLKAAKESMSFYYDVLIPQTENTLKSTQYSYENNLTTFLDLLDSYKMYQEARHMFHEAETDYLKMIAELEKATAVNLKK